MRINRRKFLETSFLAGASGIAGQALSQNLPREEYYIPDSNWVVEIIGIAQDAGVPQFGCKCSRCTEFIRNNKRLFAAGLALYNRKEKKFYLFEAAPDIREQLTGLYKKYKDRSSEIEKLPVKFSPDGVFLTHAHLGHYTGLMYFGFESMNTKNVPVYCSAGMADYLSGSGPWSQLVKYKNILLNTVKPGVPVKLSSDCEVTAWTVPHRQEFTDTVCFKIKGPERSLLFIPDIDRWEHWDRDIKDEVRKTDISILDGTFFNNKELPGRDMTKIPHPTVSSSIKLLKDSVNGSNSKVYFTHFNHSNNLIDQSGKETKFVLESGFDLAREGVLFGL